MTSLWHDHADHRSLNDKRGKAGPMGQFQRSTGWGKSIPFSCFIHMTSSRYIRGPTPTGSLCLQPRDRSILVLLARYQYLIAEHLHRLAFDGSTRRVAQRRLRQLWEHRFIERCFLPRAIIGSPTPTATPVYTLGQRGVREVAKVGFSLRPRRPHSALILEHDLMAADLMCEIQGAVRQSEGSSILVEGEHLLRSQLALQRATGAVIPDGAVSITDKQGKSSTFYIEIVRSAPRGGNRSLKQKLARYAALNRQGAFKRHFDHARVRAVLVVAMSDLKARHYQQLAAELPHSRSLFWFASRPDKGSAGLATAGAWTDGNGERCTIIHKPQG